LPKELGVGPRIDDLVGGDAREMVGGDVANTVPTGLDRMHLDRGQLGQDIGVSSSRGQLNWMFWRVVKWP